MHDRESQKQPNQCDQPVFWMNPEFWPAHSLLRGQRSLSWWGRFLHDVLNSTCIIFLWFTQFTAQKHLMLIIMHRTKAAVHSLRSCSCITERWADNLWHVLCIIQSAVFLFICCLNIRTASCPTEQTHRNRSAGVHRFLSRYTWLNDCSASCWDFMPLKLTLKNKSLCEKVTPPSAKTRKTLKRKKYSVKVAAAFGQLSIFWFGSFPLQKLPEMKRNLSEGWRRSNSQLLYDSERRWSASGWHIKFHLVSLLKNFYARILQPHWKITWLK